MIKYENVEIPGVAVYVSGMVNKIFISNMRYLRQQKGVTQVEMAKALALSQGAIAYYEAGKREPSLEQLHKISLFFEVDIDSLLRRDLRPPKPMLSNNLRFLREKMGYSLGEMAKLLDYTSVNAYRSAEISSDGLFHMNIPKLLIVSDFFGISVDDLLKRDLSKEVIA